jgi:murein DD-endopeptidase MepM/ murein hydrolase activator NlpD
MRLIVFLLLVLLVAVKTKAQISLPLKQLTVTSAYGKRIHPLTRRLDFHAGIDLRAHQDMVYAVLPGIIENTGYDPLLGFFIRLSNGPFTLIYGHLSGFLVTTDDTVTTHNCIGITGATGRVTGEHLHFAVQFNHRYIDPLTFLAAAIKHFNQ